MQTHQILNNAAERKDFSNAANDSLHALDVQSVIFSRGYNYAVGHATDSLLCR